VEFGSDLHLQAHSFGCGHSFANRMYESQGKVEVTMMNLCRKNNRAPLPTQVSNAGGVADHGPREDTRNEKKFPGVDIGKKMHASFGQQWKTLDEPIQLAEAAKFG